MTRPGVLLIAKGSHRRGRCGYCRRDVTWATLAQRGTKNIALVEAPYILREERTDTDVVVEVLGFDQVHRCPEKKSSRRRAVGPRPPSPTRHAPHADHVFSSFTPERLEALKSQLDAPKEKPPQSGRLF